MANKLDTYVDTLAELIDEGLTSFDALQKMNDTLVAEMISVVDLLDRFETVYRCLPSEYEQNLKDDKEYIIDSEFDSL